MMMKKTILLTLTLTLTLSANIPSLSTFLNTCPMEDEALTIIQQDITFTKEGKRFEFPSCQGDYLTEAYSDELATLQALRLLYHFPSVSWTDKPLYEWVVERIEGIDLTKNTATGWCCKTIEQQLFIEVQRGNTPPFIMDIKKQSPFWFAYQDVLARAATIIHEARHTEEGMDHVDCCGITRGCDKEYDEAHLSGYPMVLWFYKTILDGTVDIGFWASDLDQSVYNFAAIHETNINFFRERICNNVPPPIQLDPQQSDTYFGGKPLSTNTEIAELPKFVLFPNPLPIDYPLTIPIGATIVDTHGRIVQVSDLRRGMYLVRWEGSIQKLIVL